MKLKALLFIFITPLLYLYGLAENHFSFGKTVRTYTLDFAFEYLNAWRVLFGKQPKDNSIKVSLYEFKTRAKKAKFDLDIALVMKELYGSWHIKFDKKKRRLVYYFSCDAGDTHVGISQLSKDEFTLEYNDLTGWNRKVLSTEYVFTKEQLIDTLKMYNKKK